MPPLGRQSVRRGKAKVNLFQIHTDGYLQKCDLPYNLLFDLYPHLPYSILDLGADIPQHQSGKRHAEDACNGAHGAVYLHLVVVPVVGLGGCIGSALRSMRSGFFGLCGKQKGCTKVLAWVLLAIYAQELALRKLLFLAELGAQGACQRVALNLPELVHRHLSGIHAQGCSHAAEEPRALLAVGEGGHLAYEERLLGQRVDGIYHVIIILQTEFVSRLLAVCPAENGDVGIGVYLQQALTQSLHLGLAYGVGGGHQLAVAVAGAHAVRIHQRQAVDAASQEALGAPASHTSHAQYDDSGTIEPLHGLGAKEKQRTLEEVFLSLGHLSGIW